MNVSTLPSELGSLLADHVSRQRWYGAKHRPGVELRIETLEEVRAPWPGLLRVAVEAVDVETVERYQLVLGLRPAGDAGPATVGESAAVGVVPTPEGEAFCYDGLVDPELGLALLHHVAPSQEAAAVRPVGAEQSNSSLVYDERLIMKVFRRLTGANPEIEVTLALAQQGFPHVAEPLAVWRSNGDDLAVLQRFLPGGAEGWALAQTSIRDVLDQGVEPAEAGGDLAPEAERLGLMTAELHVALAAAFGVEPGDPHGWADATARRLSSVHHPDLDVGAVSAVLDRVRGLRDPGSSVRIHGDYHLGQVMRTDEGWYVLDFEGEPARPVEERRRPSSPLRDVAGMLRSFDYASAVGLREQAARGPSTGELDLAALRQAESAPARTPEDLAAAWERRNRDAFLAAYRSRLAGSPLLPADPASVEALLAFFELDKAVYEVAYEQAHRPDWVQIPLAAVRRLVEP
ncbi:MAG TPA: phosphotransferase [Acidimicrobiales bacterium]